MFSRGLHLRRKGCARRETRPIARTRKHAHTHARIRDVMNVKLNDAPPLLARAGEIAFCFIQEVLIIQCPGIGGQISLSTLCFETPREVETFAG